MYLDSFLPILRNLLFLSLYASFLLRNSGGYGRKKKIGKEEKGEVEYSQKSPLSCPLPSPRISRKPMPETSKPTRPCVALPGTLLIELSPAKAPPHIKKEIIAETRWRIAA